MPRVPKPVRMVDEAYREWMRSQPCVVAALGRHPGSCLGPIDACHVRSRGAGGGDPNNLFPACRKHHAEQHTLGVESFGNKYHVSLNGLARNFYRKWEESR